MPTKSLTPKQKEVHTLASKSTPIADMAKSLGVSNAGIYAHLRAVKKAGYTLPGIYGDVGQRKIKQPTKAKVNGVAPRPVTPGQAIVARRAELIRLVTDTDRHVEAAERAVAQAKEARKQVLASAAEEQRQLNAAEKALTTKAPARKRPAAKKAAKK